MSHRTSDTVTKETMRKIAHLARLGPDDASLEQLAAQANQILAFVAQLDRVNTDGVAPMAHTPSEGTPLRDDVVHDCTTREKILENAPAKDGTFFNVPKVIG